MKRTSSAVSLCQDRGVPSYPRPAIWALAALAVGIVSLGVAHALPPVADAGGPYVVEQATPDGALVTLDATGSSDPEGDPLTFDWDVDNDGTFGDASGAQPDVLFPLGVNPIAVLVTDSSGATDTDATTVTVQDTIAPAVTCPDDIVLEQRSAAGTVVSFFVTATDICDTDLDVVCAPASGSTFPLGVTAVTCSATDDSGNVGTCGFRVTVVDTTPPTINSLSAVPDTLWPPNHKMVEVTIIVDVTDACDAAPSCRIIAVSSNEPDNGLGDGNTTPDIAITSDLTLLLRAERAGIASERVYTVYVECTDASGNAVVDSVDVTVPHDRRPG